MDPMQGCHPWRSDIMCRGCRGHDGDGIAARRGRLSKPGMREQFQQMGSELNIIVGKDFARFMQDGQASLKKLADEAHLPMLD